MRGGPETCKIKPNFSYKIGSFKLFAGLFLIGTLAMIELVCGTYILLYTGGRKNDVQLGDLYLYVHYDMMDVPKGLFVDYFIIFFCMNSTPTLPSTEAGKGEKGGKEAISILMLSQTNYP